MSATSLRAHARALADFAKDAQTLSEERPDDWLAAIAAKNQSDQAGNAMRAAEAAETAERGELIELRLQGARLKNGQLPLELLSRLSEPLNRLLVRAASFARHGVEAAHGAVDDLARDLSLAVVDLAPGSTRVFIKGNLAPDLTGESALEEGLAGVIALLEDTAGPDQFYSHIDDIGERAASALRDTLRAIESEECSLELRWYRPDGDRSVSATFDRVVQMRAMLEGLEQAREVQERLTGTVVLLAKKGSLHLELRDGTRAVVRFKPRRHAAIVSTLHLDSFVTVDVVAKISPNPLTGGEIKRYTLMSLDAPLLVAEADRPAE